MKTSSYVGVSRSGNKWIGRIYVDNVLHYLGAFNCEREAAQAYDHVVDSYQLSRTKNFGSPEVFQNTTSQKNEWSSTPNLNDWASCSLSIARNEW